MAAVFGAAEPLRILCTREIQASIKESFHAELKAAIASNDILRACYDVGIDYIRGYNGTEFLFRGLRHNMDAIKSTARIDITIVEEAEDVPERSWDELEPTVLRDDGSELWVIWNPRKDGSPVDVRFRKHPPDNAVIAEIHMDDNPFAPQRLIELRQRHRTTLDPDRFLHIWYGKYLSISEAQIFKGKWRIDRFEPGPDASGPYHGLDFGFANDPTACIQCWIEGDRLLIRREAFRKGLELDHTAKFIQSKIPGVSKYVIRADNARPESISYLRRHGLPNIKPCQKGKGSVEDGIEFIKSFAEVVIHPDCASMIEEAHNYSYKIDKNTGDILPDIIDSDNHGWDAVRYALEPMMKRKTVQVREL